MKKIILLSFLCCIGVAESVAQKSSAAKKYPSLMWEISGKGMKKKAYLFGTMHVSSKLAFNLSDTFYNALANADAVALENDPGTWQQDYLSSWFTRLGSLYAVASNTESSDYITKGTFQFSYSDNPLRTALASDPEVINHFLYRSYSGGADFEENTYLDMHIYQCAKKLGKQFYGLENFTESENLMLKALEQQAGEKKRKSKSDEVEEDATAETMSLGEKIQDAYRKGNLDLMDSLSRKEMTSEGFLEYFLYRRNTIHANGIAGLIDKGLSVFAAVGAMHLPGKKGVIEMLRAKGYTLRPVNMGMQMSKKRDEINKIRIPKKLDIQYAADSLFNVKVPGKLYNFSYASSGTSNQWVHADFSNGAYYMVSRVPTQGYFWGYDEQRMNQKLDSILYENIPGKIIEQKPIVQNGYKGFDILNKTRRGDFQRYHIYITPTELIVFKMSGSEDYVKGAEGSEFFKSIQMSRGKTNWQTYTDNDGGYIVQLPHLPIKNNGNSTPSAYQGMGLFGNAKSNGIEAFDNVTNTYMFLLPKKIINYVCLEEDTFNLALAAESFAGTTQFLPAVSRVQAKESGMPYIETAGKCTDGDNYLNRIYLNGPNYYLLISKYKAGNTAAKTFVQSFKPAPFANKNIRQYTDSLYGFTVTSSLVPDSISLAFLSMTRLARKVNEEELKTSKTDSVYEKDEERMVFRNDTTNEEIVVLSKTYPKYTYLKDSVKFWKTLQDNLNTKVRNENYYDFYVKEERLEHIGNQRVYNLVFADTNSTQTMVVKSILSRGRLLTLYTLGNSQQPLSAAKQQFFNSFTPLYNKASDQDVFEPKGKLFFSDFMSKDSLVARFAQKNIGYVKFTGNDVANFKTALTSLKPESKEYFTNKTNLIREIGYLSTDEGASDLLKEVYTKAADTATFQNETILALANLKTKKSFGYLSDILINDPPVFENSDDAETLFSHITDTMELAKTILPNLLPLVNIDDYKWNVYGILSDMVDSSTIAAKDYESIYTKIYFDARIAQKKLLASDEKLMNKPATSTDDEAAAADDEDDNNYNSFYELTTFSKLLMPFWDKNTAVPTFLNKTLKTRNPEVKLQTAKVLERYKKPVADSVWADVAADEKTRLEAYDFLKEEKKEALFPARYKKQQAITKILLQNDTRQDSIVYLNKFLPATTKNNKGNVYFFKYKQGEKDLDWKIALCGLQPTATADISTDKTILVFTDKILKNNVPLDEQLAKALKEELYNLRLSSSNFFEKADDYGSYLNRFRN